MNADQFAIRFPRTFAAYTEGFAAGHHIGAQMFFARDRQTLADVGLGESRPGVPVTADTLMLWLSAGKPVTAVAVLQLWERGQIDLDDPVARYVPEFAQNGKEAITIRHLLTHTSGFRFAAIGFEVTDWPEVVERVCALKLERAWIPGQTAGYHPFTSWFILGEIVQRVSGRPFAQYVRDEIFLPLGMRDSWIGMTHDEYRAYGDRISLMQNTEKPDKPPHFYSTEDGARLGSPGGGGQGPMRELGRFYEMLLAGGELDGARILESSTVAAMISRQREGLFDETFNKRIDWGFGLLLDSKRYRGEHPYGYGPYASDGTFGHSGSQSSTAFADPEFRLVVAIAFNGMPGEAAHQARIRQTLAAVYEDLGLAGDRASFRG